MHFLLDCEWIYALNNPRQILLYQTLQIAHGGQALKEIGSTMMGGKIHSFCTNLIDCVPFILDLSKNENIHKTKISLKALIIENCHQLFYS
jgi:hypothetical protein